MLHPVPDRPPPGERHPEVLDATVCAALLRHAHVGRLGYVLDGRPQIVPMNYAVDGEGVVVRLGEGATLAAIRAGSPVAFQVDGVDEVYHHGWSVVLHGRAEEVLDADEVERVLALPSRPWAGGTRDHVVRILPERWTGRRIG